MGYAAAKSHWNLLALSLEHILLIQTASAWAPELWSKKSLLWPEQTPLLCPGSPQSAAVLVAAIATWMDTNEAKVEISHLLVTIWFQKGSYPLTCFDKERGGGKHLSPEVKLVTVWPKWTESQQARLIKLIFTLFDNVPDSRLSCVHSTKLLYFIDCYHMSSLFPKCTRTQCHKILLYYLCYISSTRTQHLY